MSNIPQTPLSPRLVPISGIGGKLPACFLVETGAARFLLDLGEGPEPGVRPDISGVGKVDAILLSHAHEDHANALDLASGLGNPPVYASRSTWDYLPMSLVPQERRRIVTPGERGNICGIEVTCGRAGHAPGSLWFHLSVGNGLLYAGDHTAESCLYPFDPPPRAGTAILDASYGDFDVPLAHQVDQLLEALVPGAILPVPGGGRGPEMALRLYERTGRAPFIDDSIRRQIDVIVGGRDEMVLPDAARQLENLLAALPEHPGPEDVILCTDANLTSGLSKTLHEQHGTRRPYLFTGHVPPNTPAFRLLESGKARWQRWNVHPRRSELVELAKAIGAQTVLLAFGDPEKAAALRADLQPSTVVTQARPVSL